MGSRAYRADFTTMDHTLNYALESDESLIRFIAQAHEGALSELYDRYGQLVFSLAVHIVADRAAAEEVALDVFKLVWDKAGTYRAKRSKVYTWLTTITRHRAIDELRRRRSRPAQHSLDWDQVTAGNNVGRQTVDRDPETAADLAMQRERVRAAVAQLPGDQRQVLALAYFKGLTQREIAEGLELPLGTVKTRIRLGMQKLRGWLEDERFTPGKSKIRLHPYNISEEL